MQSQRVTSHYLTHQYLVTCALPRVSRDISNTNNHSIYAIYNCKSLSVSSQQYIPIVMRNE